MDLDWLVTQVPPAALHLLHGGSRRTTAAATALARVYYLHMLLRTNDVLLHAMRFFET